MGRERKRREEGREERGGRVREGGREGEGGSEGGRERENKQAVYARGWYGDTTFHYCTLDTRQNLMYGQCQMSH